MEESSASESGVSTRHAEVTAQHKRLFFCIQSATSKLQDVSCPLQRVENLTRLIPSNPVEELGIVSLIGQNLILNYHCLFFLQMNPFFMEYLSTTWLDC